MYLQYIVVSVSISKFDSLEQRSSCCYCDRDMCVVVTCVLVQTVLLPFTLPQIATGKSFGKNILNNLTIISTCFSFETVLFNFHFK